MTIQGDIAAHEIELPALKEPSDCPYCGALRLYRDFIYNRYTLRDDNVWGCIICFAVWVTTGPNTHEISYVIDYPTLDF